MKIVTVTLNPAIDQTVQVANFRANSVNFGQAMQFDAGGKGVNVASFLADYGHPVTATGFLGTENQEPFQKLFREKKIVDEFIRIPGYTRIGIKIADEANQQTTDINMPGQGPTVEAVEQFFRKLHQLAAVNDCFVLAGTLPPGVPDTLYAEIITYLKRKEKLIVLDSRNDALAHAVKAAPQIIKPNIDELKELVGQPLRRLESIQQAAKQLLQHGIRLVIVSLGEKGAMFVNQQETFLVQPPAVTVKSTVGAGDAMVAGLVAGKSQQLSLPDCARLATAFAVGTITRIGPNLPPLSMINQYLHQVQIRHI